MKTNLLYALLLFSSTTALAEEAASVNVPAPPPKKDRGEVMLALKVGGLFPEAFSNLQASYLVGLELGYALPVLKHRLALSIEAGYTAPQANGSQSDPRLDQSGGTYSWHLEQRDVMLGLTLYYRHPLGKDLRFIPYIGVGPRLFLLQSRVTGQAGAAPILLSTEQSSKFGAGIPVGIGFKLGPGHAFLEAAVIVGNVDHLTTGNASVGVSSITLSAGYRFML